MSEYDPNHPLDFRFKYVFSRIVSWCELFWHKINVIHWLHVRGSGIERGFVNSDEVRGPHEKSEKHEKSFRFFRLGFGCFGRIFFFHTSRRINERPVFHREVLRLIRIKPGFQFRLVRVGHVFQHCILYASK